MKRLIVGTYIFGKRNRGKKSSRDVTDHMIKTRSSNIWSYAYDIPEGSREGTMYVQFKNEVGRPGDIYRYYDVPYQIYQRFVSAPSKGHAHWVLIRNKFKYSKLTGDKRGVLPNAVNN